MPDIIEVIQFLKEEGRVRQLSAGVAALVETYLAQEPVPTEAYPFLRKAYDAIKFSEPLTDVADDAAPVDGLSASDHYASALTSSPTYEKLKAKLAETKFGFDKSSCTPYLGKPFGSLFHVTNKYTAHSPTVSLEVCSASSLQVNQQKTLLMSTQVGKHLTYALQNPMTVMNYAGDTNHKQTQITTTVFGNVKYSKVWQIMSYAMQALKSQKAAPVIGVHVFGALVTLKPNLYGNIINISYKGKLYAGLIKGGYLFPRKDTELSPEIDKAIKKVLSDIDYDFLGLILEKSVSVDMHHFSELLSTLSFWGLIHPNSHALANPNLPQEYKAHLSKMMHYGHGSGHTVEAHKVYNNQLLAPSLADVEPDDEDDDIDVDDTDLWAGLLPEEHPNIKPKHVGFTPPSSVAHIDYSKLEKQYMAGLADTHKFMDAVSKQITPAIKTAAKNVGKSAVPYMSDTNTKKIK